MKQYLKVVTDVLLLGEPRQDRTGTGTSSIFDTRAKWDLRLGFPAVTTKKLAWRSVVGELLWFLSGSTNIYDLEERTYGTRGERRTIWHPNYEEQAVALGYEDGELGPVYGHQWRDFGGVDQILQLFDSIIISPHGRRHLVSAWNPADMPKMALPPCHYSFQCYVSNDGHIDLKWHQRSVDVFLGLPFNIASYALLLHIIGQITGYKPRYLTFDGGDTHIYNDHMEQISEQMKRVPYDLPKLEMPTFCNLETLAELSAKDFNLVGYQHHPALKGKMSA